MENLNECKCKPKKKNMASDLNREIENMKIASGIADTGKIGNCLERVFKTDIRSPVTTATKAKEKQNRAEHAGNRIILRNVKFLLDALEIGNGKQVRFAQE